MQSDYFSDVPRAMRVASLLAQMPGWVFGALLRRAQRELRRDQRSMLLEPNKDSYLKVERYVFSAVAMIEALGTAQETLDGCSSPDVNFRAQHVATNIPHPGMVLITDARVANVSFTVGGLIDAWGWNPQACQEIDLPTLTPANKASFSAEYTGRLPADMQDLDGKQFHFIMSFTGPALLQGSA